MLSNLVAIRAHQSAFLDLGDERLHRWNRRGVTDVELLRRWIDVVELQDEGWVLPLAVETDAVVLLELPDVGPGLLDQALGGLRGAERGADAWSGR